jgi:hypothetical protein
MTGESDTYVGRLAAYRHLAAPSGGNNSEPREDHFARSTKRSDDALGLTLPAAILNREAAASMRRSLRCTHTIHTIKVSCSSASMG